MASIVIKVRFGETLRRLNVSINEGKLDLDMIMLKEKIRSFFSFGSDVEFTMTYVDEDGDAVTLADDDDLHDVVSQSLNPLRITVNLNGSNFIGSGGNLTPLKSPQNQHSFQTLNSGVAEILKSVPEPLLEALAKLPLDLASKVSSSAPVVAELVENMKTMYLDPILPSVASPRVHPTTGGPPTVNSESSTVKNSKVQVNPKAGGSHSKKKEKQVQKITVGVKFKDVQLPQGVDLNIPHFESGSIQAPISSNSEKKNDISNGSLNETLKPDSYVEHTSQVRQNLKHMSQNLQNQMVAQRALFAQLAAGINKNTNNSGSSSGRTQGLLNAANQCPFSGMPLTCDSDTQGHSHQFNTPHWKSDNLDNNGTNNIFHRGVICDGCGVHPITGPRFKSKVKNNYDLCHFCFVGMGNATDYIRMDLPATRDHLLPSFRIPPPPVPLSQLKLDSRLIHVVSVFDGTIMAPFTAFTKIWRIRNNGSINWPYGSQIQWVGGSCLSSSLSVDVEIPLDGLPVGEEVDISVGFTAPELPGRYDSYWQMASPSGTKFGERVWVMIQVVASMKGETSINLNLPPVTNLKAVDQDHEMKFPVNDSLIIDNDSDNGSVSSTMAIISAPLETISSPVYNSTAVGTALGLLPVGPMVTSGVYPTLGLGTEPISYPEVDFSVMPPVSGAASLPTVMVQPPWGSGSPVSDDQEQDPVKVLEAMGFKQSDLNKEILRMNKYDLDKSIDDLCGVLEWDPMLDELREMGFADVEANRRLLKKNNGSIKGVVMDLISEEKP